MANQLEILVRSRVRSDIGIGILLIIAVAAASSIIAFALISASATTGPTAIIQTNSFGKSGTTITMIAPATIVFSGAASTGAVRYDWDFGDASNAAYPQQQEGMIVGHRFDIPDKTFNVTLTAYDAKGIASMANFTVITKSRPTTAKTYYIDSVSGSNANDGLSETTAWHDIQKFYSTATPPTFYDSVPDGSQILFHRGQTFDLKGSWELNRREGADNYQQHTLLRYAPYYMTLGAYGIGVRPVLMSSVPYDYTSKGLISVEDYSNQGLNGRGIIIDGLEVRGTIWSHAYLFGQDSERPGMNVIVRNTKISPGQFAVWGSDGTVFEQGEIDPQGGNYVGFGSTANPFFTFVSQSNIHSSASHCVYLSGNSQNTLIENNSLHDCGSTSWGGITAHGQQYNWDIRGNTIYNNNFAIGIDANVGYPDYLQNIVIEKNKIFNNGDYNAGHTSGHTFQLSSIKGLTIKNNLIYANPGASQPVFWIRGASVVQDMSNVNIFNNTIYSNTAGIMNIDAAACPVACASSFLAGGGVCPTITASCNGTQDIHFKNNIIVGSNNSPIVTDNRKYTAAEAKNYLDLSNNIYFNFSASSNQFNSPLGSFTLANWLKSANDSGSLALDPLFNNPAAGDFSLKAGSPAINAGVQLNVPYDISGVLRGDSMPDIGAFETPASALSKSVVSTVAANPPTTIATPAAGTYAAAQNITLAATNASGVNGIPTTYYCLGAGCTPNLQYFGANITVASSQSISYYSIDSVGAKEAIKTASYVISAPIAAVKPVAPSIISQPKSAAGSVGGSASLSVVASGTTPLYYQWMKGGANILGATAATLNFSNLQLTDKAYYTVKISNSVSSKVSNQALLSVTIVRPSITIQPAAQTVNAGSKVIFTVGASGTAPLKYQWKRNGAVISGATGPSYAIDVASKALSGSKYSVTVTNSGGSANSNNALLTVQ